MLSRTDVRPRGLIVLGALLLSACLDPIPPNTVTKPGQGSVAGTVTHLCTRAPMAGVLVTPRPMDNGAPGEPGQATQTDAAGGYRLEGLGQGTWQLMFSMTGFQSVEQTVVVRGGQEEQAELTLAPVPSQLPKEAELDVLFVVDNSNSMSEEQLRLAQAFPRFMNALLLYGFTLDARIGVISTDLGAGNYGLPSCEDTGGDGGVLQSNPKVAGCSPPTDPYISLVGTTTNVPDDMVNDAFGCIVQLGTGGCGFEQPLGAVLRAVDGKSNPGFPRKSSVLAVVVISDEDDCTAVDEKLYDSNQSSLEDPLGPLTSFRCFEFGVTCDINDRTKAGPRADCKPTKGGYLLDVDDFVSQLTKDRTKDRVFFSVIAGPASKVEVGMDGGNPVLRPSCQTSSTSAAPAIRLQAVVDQLPQSSFDTICIGDLGAALANVARQIAEKTIFTPCAQ